MLKMFFRNVCFVLALKFCLVESQTCSKKVQLVTHDSKYLSAPATDSFLVASIMQCSQKCLAKSPACPGANFKKTQENRRHVCRLTTQIIVDEFTLLDNDEWIFLENTKVELKSDCDLTQYYGSCKEILRREPSSKDGVYTLDINKERFQVYCDMSDGGFTLAARFSNSDAKNWMQASGHWWYDLQSVGNSTTVNENKDSLSKAFSTVIADDFKVTQSNDTGNNALLLASACLGNSSMREKLASYGNFRNGAVWTTGNKCLGSCKAVFANGSASVKGFKWSQSACSGTSDILQGDNVGFWCKYELGDGAVIMIGGGGGSCSRADHGIGITEINTPTFGPTNLGYFDFGDDARPANQAIYEDYALNLWVR